MGYPVLFSAGNFVTKIINCRVGVRVRQSRQGAYMNINAKCVFVNTWPRIGITYGMQFHIKNGYFQLTTSVSRRRVFWRGSSMR